MEHSPSWENNLFSASQEIPRILCNPKVHHRTHKCTPTVPIPSQLDPVHTPISNFLMIHLNIFLSSTPGFPKLSPSLRFPDQNPVYPSPLPHSCYIPRSSHSSRFYHPNSIGWGVHIAHKLPTYCKRPGWLLYGPSDFHSFNIPRSAHTVYFLRFICIWEQTVIISPCNINWLVFITETGCVYCAVRTGFL